MTLVFPDTTTLLNFAYIGRMDLLRRLVNGKGVWCGAVAQESASWAASEGFEAVSESTKIFGEPIFPTLAEHVDIQVLRTTMAGPGDGPRQHLGEAETIVIARSRFPGARFVTDDAGARAAAQTDGLLAVGTGDLLDLAIEVGFLDRPVSEGYQRILARAQRFAARWL